MARKSYSDDEITRALLAVIAAPTYEAAAELLAEEGPHVTGRTLHRWATQAHVTRFEQLREQHAPRMEAELAATMLSNARQAAEVERMGIERSREMLESGDVAEPWRMARDLSQVKSQSVDKRLALQGRPTQIIERRSPEEVLARLVSLRVASIDGEATEEPPALPAPENPQPEETRAVA